MPARAGEPTLYKVQARIRDLLIDEAARVGSELAERARACLPAAVRPLCPDLDGTSVLLPRRRRGAASVVYLPGRWGNSRLWAVREPSSDPRTALVMSGLPVVTARYRCSAAEHRQVTVATMAAVTTRDLLEDIAEAIGLAASLFGPGPVVLCGYSMGAALGFLSAAHPKVRALVSLDGGLPATAQAPCGQSGCVANPSFHPRHLESALAQLADPVTARHDVLSWRISHDLLWPAAQLDEIRTGELRTGRDVSAHLAEVTCPILCVAADDRDALDDLRGPRTAACTGASDVRTILLRGWRHEEVVTRPRANDEGLVRRIVEFIDQCA